MLGYTQVMWDNWWGPQPSSFDKTWGALTEQEKEAAVILGYTEIIWDNFSGYETQPASAEKSWIELTVCGECRCALYLMSAVCCMVVDSGEMEISDIRKLLN